MIEYHNGRWEIFFKQIFRKNGGYAKIQGIPKIGILIVGEFLSM
jgi:hypothetical protein